MPARLLCSYAFTLLYTLTSTPAYANEGPLVEVVTVERSLVRDELVTFGSLRPDESVMIRPEIAGRIAQLHFREGQRIEAGALLVSLDDSIVTAPSLPRRGPTWTLAQNNFQRAQMLFKRGASNAQALDEASAQQQAARASLALSQARLDKTRIFGPAMRVCWGCARPAPAITSAKARTSSTWKCSTRSRSISVSRKRRSARSVSNKPSKSAWMPIPVSASSGEIFAVNPRLDEVGRSQAIRAHISNSEGRLSPGQFVRVSVILAERPNALVIPEEAIMPMGEQRCWSIWS